MVSPVLGSLVSLVSLIMGSALCDVRGSSERRYASLSSLISSRSAQDVSTSWSLSSAMLDTQRGFLLQFVNFSPANLSVKKSRLAGGLIGRPHQWVFEMGTGRPVFMFAMGS